MVTDEDNDYMGLKGTIVDVLTLRMKTIIRIMRILM